MKAAIGLFLVIVTGACVIWLAFPQRTESAEEKFTLPDDYDIRTDSRDEAKAAVRRLAGKDIADPGESESRLRETFPDLKLEFNNDLRVPEVISTPDAANFLTAPSDKTRVEIFRDFLKRRSELFGLDHGQIDSLSVTADYTNPNGKLSFVHLAQRANGVPVFRGEVKAVFTSKNEIVRVINNAAPEIDNAAVPSEFGSPEEAVLKAAGHLSLKAGEAETKRIASDDLKVTFERGGFADQTTAEKMYFPITAGVVRPAWRVLIWTGADAFYVIVDAEDGTLLWQKNIANRQTLPATFNVYGNSTSPMKTADSPSPFSPGCFAPTGCPQAPAIPRANFTLIGNEAPYSFNSLGWIPDTGLPVRTPANPNITDGNNVEAGIDRVPPDGIDPDGWARGNPNRVFSYTYNPAPGIPPPGEDPLPPNPQPFPPTQFQQGAIAHGFYTVNRWHDEMYRFGFTEQAQNFQHFNFGRGGAEGDRVSFELQDQSGTNSANFLTPADGNRPRMQMFIWTGATPRRDGALDAEVVLHEITHGLSNRLHGNTMGLSTNMARGMSEGWSDFYAMALLSEPTDDPLGTHVVGGYITLGITTNYESNYYYGIRRFPTAVYASLGPNGRPHSPLTFSYINADCNPRMATAGAYSRGPIGVTQCDQVHNLGEFWSAALWEVRGQLVEARGPAEGNRRALQYITDGMKLSPLAPNMLQSRDAILVATQVSDPNDVCAVWRGFAIRGLGSGATIINTSPANVTESFVVPPSCRATFRADFDGDLRSDFSVFRPSEGIWYRNASTTGFAATRWGLSTDVPVAGDFDGDVRVELAVFRPQADGSLPDFYVFNNLTSTISYISWGLPGDIPVVEDYDGDNRADAAVFRPSTGVFWIRRSSDGGTIASNAFPAGLPLSGDFDGDGRSDFGTFGNGQWTISRSAGSFLPGISENWGLGSDTPVPADYDGDGRLDIAVFRPDNGVWYIRRSGGGVTISQFGLATDRPVPADYDGDGRADIAVYRSGLWYVNGSTAGFSVTRFGLAEDVPIPESYLP